MKYFIDTEFLEGPQKEPFPISLFRKETKPTIDLISIGMVCEDGREYYAISKDFNLKEAWNRWQPRTGEGDRNNLEPRLYWIRENVLKPIFDDLMKMFKHDWLTQRNREKMVFLGYMHPDDITFEYDYLKELIKRYGKTNQEIAKDIRNFVYMEAYDSGGQILLGNFIPNDTPNPEFYAYYADYDWVAFCWLFGNMMDLPTGFPMYCRDLKQTMDERVHEKKWLYGRDCWSNNNRSVHDIGSGDHQEKDREATLDEKLKLIQELKEYPKLTNEHNALADAKWNRELYQFIQSL